MPTICHMYSVLVLIIAWRITRKLAILLYKRNESFMRTPSYIATKEILPKNRFGFRIV